MISIMIRQGIVEVTGGDFPWSTYKLHAKRTKPRPERPVYTKYDFLEAA